MQKDATTPVVLVTANDLRDGGVVFLGIGSGGWSRDFHGLTPARDAAERERLMTEAAGAVRANRVLNPYAIDMVADGAGWRPLRRREQIRAADVSPAVNPLAATAVRGR